MSDQVKIGSIALPEYLRPTYANFVNVNHTPWDFRLTFAVVRTPLEGEVGPDEDGNLEIHPEGVSEVIIPANLVFGLISALKENFDRYVGTYGAPGMDPEGPRTSE